jgi:hypothetical protein
MNTPEKRRRDLVQNCPMRAVFAVLGVQGLF